MKKFVRVLSLLVLLSGCANKVELKPEIEEYLSHVSLDEAISAYTHARYTSDKVITDSNVKTVHETFFYDIRDIRNISYEYVHEEKENDVTTLRTVKTIETIDNKYYFQRNDDEKEVYTYEKVLLVIQQFFYTEIKMDFYHKGGMYYGDYIRETAPTNQQFMSVDVETGVLTYSYENYKYKDITTSENYHIDNLGMLIDGTLTQYNDYLRVEQRIVVEKLD